MIPTLDQSSAESLIQSCGDYMDARTGRYDWRAVRYNAARKALELAGLNDRWNIADIGAGWTEFDYNLRTESGFRGVYYPVDGLYDGVDLESWSPARYWDAFVALELLEHLSDPDRMLRNLQGRGGVVIVSTPNPATTDVLGMDPTHKTPITQRALETYGFDVQVKSFYGEPDDSLFGVWMGYARKPAGSR